MQKFFTKNFCSEAPTTVSQKFVIIDTHKPKIYITIKFKKIKIFATLSGYGKYY